MSGRDEIFSGTETPPEHLALDLGALRAWLASAVPELPAPERAEKFKGGQSNPTYRLTGAGRAFVLRRRPPGELLATAHDILREYRVIAALHGTAVPTPRPWAYCEDPSVIGSAFYVVENIEGRVFWDAEMPGATPPQRATIYDDMNRALAALHALDPASLGLADLGRSEGYVARNFARWTKVYAASRLADVPEMDWLAEALPRHFPPDKPGVLIHGDYGLYNIIATPRLDGIAAVLDWEMATLGDPFVDLAHHLRAWWDLRDDTGAATSLRGRDLATLGIPTMAKYVASYCDRAGGEAPDMTVYLAFAQYRYAAMIQGILKRAANGTSSSRQVLHTQERVAAVARLARRTLEYGAG